MLVFSLAQSIQPSQLSGDFLKVENFANFLKSHDLIPAPQRGMFTIVPTEDPDANVASGFSSNKSTFWNTMKPLSGESREEIFEKLKAGGFRKEGVPEFLGGTWDGKAFLEWLQKQREEDPNASVLEPPRYVVDYCRDSDSPQEMDGKKPNVVSEDENMNDEPKQMSVEEATMKMEEVIWLLPDGEEKDAYREASSEVPELIRSESNPLWYLRAANFDAWDAAKSLTAYWFYRKRWFGDRALLPMDLSGDGALSEDDVDVFGDGTAQLLPCDNVGRPVIFFEQLPIDLDDSSPVRKSRLRILFYLATLANRMQTCRDIGIVFIVLCKEEEIDFRPFKWRESQGFLNHGIASKVANGYLLSFDSSRTNPGQLQVIKEVLTDNVSIITLPEEGGIEKMREIGLSDAGIPDILGGNWDRTKFDEWYDERHKHDSDIYHAEKELDKSPETPKGGGFDAGPNHQYVLLARLESALMGIDIADKIDLLTARERAPALVALESPPSKFLQCEDVDFPRAAKRWCNYWRGRRHLFGDIALQPFQFLVASLTPPEKAIYDRMSKNNVAYDSHGRGLIAFSGKIASSSGLCPHRLGRIMFVLVHPFIHGDINQTDGIVMFRRWLPSTFQPMGYKAMDDVVATMMPFRISVHHLLCVLPETGKLSYYQSISSRLFGYTSEALAQKTNVHLADNPEGVKELLIAMGYDISTLPPVLESQIWGSGDFSKNEASQTGTSVNTDPMPMELSSEDVKVLDKITIQGYIARYDPREVEAFAEAQKTAKDVLPLESYPRRYLSLEHQNGSRAVHRLIKYWKERKRIFGTRAFLPLDQTGEGVLSKEDIAVLNSGFLSVLQNDGQNVPVGIFDGSRAIPEQNETAIRLMFYVGSVLCEYDVNESLTCRFVIVASVLLLDCGLGKLLQFLEDVLPIKVKDIFIVPAPSERGKASFFESVAPQIIRLLGPRMGARAVVIKSDTPKKRAKELVKCGFEEKALPFIAGGEWNYAKFFQWQETRIRIEWGLPLSAVQRLTVPNGKSYSVPGLSELPEPDQIERKRRLNLLHSRRKREKERAQIEALQEQVSDLEESNKSVNDENARLEEALRRASAYLPAAASMPVAAPARRERSPVLAPPSPEADPGEETDRQHADHAMMAEPSGVVMQSSGNKRILEEFLLQTPQVSVPSSVWVTMMTNQQRQLQQQSFSNESLRQLLSRLSGADRAAGSPPEPLYPPNPEEEQKRRRI